MDRRSNWLAITWSSDNGFGMFSGRREVSPWCLREVVDLDSAGGLGGAICSCHGWDLLTALSNVL